MKDVHHKKVKLWEQYKYEDSKLLGSVVCFAKLVVTGFRVVLSEHTMAKTELLYPKNVGLLVAMDFT